MKHNTLRHIWALTALLMGSLAAVACLKNGEDTLALEEGNPAEMILGSWKVERSELLDELSGKLHSDMPDDNWRSNVFDFQENSAGEVSMEGLSPSPFFWSLGADGTTLDIDGQSFRLASLGKRIMSLESARFVNGESYLHRYILRHLTSSDKSDNVAEPDDDETQLVSSDNGLTFRRYGYTVIVPKGAVPRNSDNGPGRVAFSIQLSEDLPSAVPGNKTILERGNVKIEPMNFTFISPITIKVPLRGFDPSEISIYWYDGFQGKWVLIPFSKINSDGTVSITMIELGQFIVVRDPDAAGREELSTGGIHIAKKYIQNGYIYYLTLTPSNLFGSSKSIAFSSNSEDLYMAGVELGNYTASITRERRRTSNDTAVSTETAFLGKVNVATPLRKGKGGYNTYTGWTELTLDDAGWGDGRPKDWGDITITYGTGKFQATLTWVNSYSQAVDYDLHLTSPDGEVFFAHRQAGSFELDRDWLEEAGNAVENIYSIKDTFTPGTYKVRVQLYDGKTGLRYNCRIIVNGTVVKSQTGAITTKKAYDDIYTFTID